MDIATEENNIKYAGFWRRVAASLIDTIMYYVIFYAVIYSMGYNLDSPELSFTSPLGIAELTLLPLYFIIMHASKWQATIGKRIMKVFVVKKSDLQKISFVRSFFRQLSQWITILPFLVPILLISNLTNGEINSYSEYETALLEVEETLIECEESCENDEEINACYEECFEFSESTLIVTFALVIAGIVMFIMMFFWYGIAGWTREKTAMHDMICGTRTLKGRK